MELGGISRAARPISLARARTLDSRLGLTTGGISASFRHAQACSLACSQRQRRREGAGLPTAAAADGGCLRLVLAGAASSAAAAASNDGASRGFYFQRRVPASKGASAGLGAAAAAPAGGWISYGPAPAPARGSGPHGATGKPKQAPAASAGSGRKASQEWEECVRAMQVLKPGGPSASPAARKAAGGKGGGRVQGQQSEALTLLTKATNLIKEASHTTLTANPAQIKTAAYFARLHVRPHRREAQEFAKALAAFAADTHSMDRASVSVWCVTLYSMSATGLTDRSRSMQAPGKAQGVGQGSGSGSGSACPMHRLLHKAATNLGPVRWLEPQARVRCQTASNMLWAFGAADYQGPKGQLLAGIGAAASKKLLDGGTTQEMSNTLWALAKLGWTEEAEVAQLADVFLRDLIRTFEEGRCNGQDLSNTLWAAATAGGPLAAKRGPLVAAAAHAMLKHNAMAESNCQVCSNALWAVSRLYPRLPSAPYLATSTPAPAASGPGSAYEDSGSSSSGGSVDGGASASVDGAGPVGPGGSPEARGLHVAGISGTSMASMDDEGVSSRQGSPALGGSSASASTSRGRTGSKDRQESHGGSSRSPSPPPETLGSPPRTAYGVDPEHDVALQVCTAATSRLKQLLGSSPGEAVPRVNGQDLTLSAASLATIGLYDPHLFDLAVTCMPRMLREGRAQAVDVSALLWACSRIGHGLEAREVWERGPDAAGHPALGSGSSTPAASPAGSGTGSGSSSSTGDSQPGAPYDLAFLSHIQDLAAAVDLATLGSQWATRSLLYLLHAWAVLHDPHAHAALAAQRGMPVTDLPLTRLAKAGFEELLARNPSRAELTDAGMTQVYLAHTEAVEQGLLPGLLAPGHEEAGQKLLREARVLWARVATHNVTTSRSQVEVAELLTDLGWVAKLEQSLDHSSPAEAEAAEAAGAGGQTGMGGKQGRVLEAKMQVDILATALPDGTPCRVAVEFDGPDHFVAQPWGGRILDGPSRLRARQLSRRIDALVPVRWWEYAGINGMRDEGRKAFVERLMQPVLEKLSNGLGGQAVGSWASDSEQP